MTSQLVERLRTGPVARRMAGGIAANFLGKVWVLLLQLLSVPVLTFHWGVEGYGIWLMLITIPTYIFLSDFGFGQAAGVELTRRAASNDHAGALEVFQSAWVFVTAVSVGGGLAILLASVTSLPYTGLPVVGDLRVDVGLVVIYALLIVQTQLLQMVFRATNRYAQGTLFVDLAMLGEGLLHLAAVLLGGNIVLSLLIHAATRAAALVGLLVVLRRHEPWLTLGVGRARMVTVKSLASPSLGAIALSVANSLVVQGVVLTLGWATGAATVAVFATSRLISRVPLQFAGLITRASIPELTRAAHTRQNDTVERLVRLNTGTSLLLALPASVVLLLWGPDLLALLSSGRLVAAYDLFVPLVLAGVVGTIWASLATPLIATNRHSTFSYVYLAAATATITIPLLVAGHAAIATAWATLVAELLCCVVILAQLKKNLSHE